MDKRFGFRQRWARLPNRVAYEAYLPWKEPVQDVRAHYRLVDQEEQPWSKGSTSPLRRLEVESAHARHLVRRSACYILGRYQGRLRQQSQRHGHWVYQSALLTHRNAQKGCFKTLCAHRCRTKEREKSTAHWIRLRGILGMGVNR